MFDVVFMGDMRSVVGELSMFLQSQKSMASVEEPSLLQIKLSKLT